MEEKVMKLKIEIRSREMIKPSTPTPLHLNTFNLSLLDQIFPAFHILLLLFYPSKPENASHFRINNLKTSLSQTLSHFYPLAGRCIDDSKVSCNDEGVPFFETFVNSRLSDVIGSSNIDVLTKFVPPRDLLALGPLPISELVPLAFQVNVFACGGVVIGCYMLHKLLDAASLGNFFRYWAALASRRYKDVVEPDFNAIVKAFPPCPSIDRFFEPGISKDLLSDSPPLVVLVKSFRLTNAAVTDLKTMAASKAVPNPTSFETVAGFIWWNTVDAACAARSAKHEPVPETTILSVSINMRSRTNPPLPRESMGNCGTHAQSKAIRLGTFPELVLEIHETVSRVKPRIEAYLGENGAEEIYADRKAASHFVMEDNACVYQLSSWCKLGLNEADFGFGRSNRIIPTDGIIPQSLKNLIFFTDYSDSSSDGIEVWLFLEETEMQILESNTKFLHFVSPNYLG